MKFAKLSQVAGIIFKIRTLLTREALMLVYHALVGSKLRYALVCWATANQTLLEKVNVAHNRIITYMTFSKRCSRMWPLLANSKYFRLIYLSKLSMQKPCTNSKRICYLKYSMTTSIDCRQGFNFINLQQPTAN